MNNDCGHEKYLNQLQQDRFDVSRALERLGRRAADVLCKQKKWFRWVRQRQDDEEKHRDNQSKKVKLEAALFRRHQKEVESRMKVMRAKEDLKRQEDYLNQAYLESLSEDEEIQWDSVEDVVENERGNYVDLIKYFLMLKDIGTEHESNVDQENSGETAPKDPENKESVDPAQAKASTKKQKKPKAEPNPANSDKGGQKKRH